jgi:F-type H+-transporting ATPase subunit b
MISIDWTLFYQMALFIALMIFLGKFLFKPMTAVFDAREKAHLGPAAKAEELAELAEKASENYKDLMSQARKKGEQIRNEFLGDAQKHEREIVAGAQAKSEETIEAARQEIEAARTRLAGELPGQAQNLATQLTKKLLGR